MKDLPRKYVGVMSIGIITMLAVPAYAQEATSEPETRPTAEQRERGPRPRPAPARVDAELATGPLTQEEIQVLRQMIRDYQQRSERRRNRGNVENRGSDPENRSERRQEMLQRFDTDGDGVLSAEERRIAIETMREERMQQRGQ